MAVKDIGALIKSLRMQKGLTQEELAFPIIEQAALSRLESGASMPHKKTVEALLEKLGFNPNNIDFYVDKKQAAKQQMMDELEALLETETAYSDQEERTRKADVLIKELESDSDFMSNDLNRQFVLTYKAFSAWFKKEDGGRVLEMLHEAIKVSIPGYDELRIEEYYLSKQDLRLINTTTLVYRDNGNLEKGIEILVRLKNNIEKQCIDKTARGKYYASVTHNLAQFLYWAKRYEEASQMCDQAIAICRETGVFRLLPFIAGYKANCLCRFGKMEESERMHRLAFYTAEAFGKYGWCEMVQKSAKDNFGADYGKPLVSG